MIKVLIAEDEPLSLQNLTDHLRRLLGADALIEGAANGREAMGMSSFYFSRFFRTAYNRTFLEYLTSYRIERAEELLRQTDIPVREIAPRVGYTDANYFTKVFKRHCGCTPTDYRSRL